MQTDNGRTHTQDLAAAWGQSQAFPCPDECEAYGMDFRGYLIGQAIQGSAVTFMGRKLHHQLIAKQAILIADEVLLQLSLERTHKSQEATHG
jgi:hypothetical protein